MGFLKRGVLAAAIFVGSSVNTSLAQDAGSAMGNSAVVIKNTSDRELVYSVRAQDGAWSELRIQPRKSTIVRCGNCSADLYNFSIESETKSVSYDLLPGRHYSIFWNNRLDAWDLRSDDK
jgi:hypothetical protein